MTVSLRPRNVVLDDGEFLLALHDGNRAEFSAGFLERRCPVTPETPRGLECVGACTRISDGSWEVRIAVPESARCSNGHHSVVSGVARLDALVSLWRARREAHVRYTSSLPGSNF